MLSILSFPCIFRLCWTKCLVKSYKTTVGAALWLASHLNEARGYHSERNAPFQFCVSGFVEHMLVSVVVGAGNY